MIIKSSIKAAITAWRKNCSTSPPENAEETFDQGLTDIIATAITSANATILVGTVSTGASPAVVPLPTNLLLSIS